ncbi:antibiotic biosynthesis monooxygenase [Rhizobium ruizarguesonis]|uniref:antibiotic biosynthesis monooxygenase family protein n=1 Tax=Rhizobium leguminosarum TaxID=384 RepID=UPI001030280D|nr:antibiotic biosynthesis monooxygenase [Rhizobium leguminosarum]TAV50198.1 antibiotic biosynthesis monooxygenase [Rhizobium leguminosarum]TAV59561.1 antibiotic biosynthesis monooxygenase [Rhizobium leguminosarum]TAV70608.1 antibiotic biosynthesis monooxygenase [Rhizobium leguminosarum]TAY68225.1 antibiotic biosynthesis monooxygenase [Rhizobium leguminosarum]
MSIATLPAPPYYVVCFSSQRTEVDDGYGDVGAAMVELAMQQPGFLGFESVRRADGFGIINSYWKDEESILAWKAVLDHVEAQRRGKTDWYTRYEIRVALVQRAYGFDADVANRQ